MVHRMNTHSDPTAEGSRDASRSSAPARPRIALAYDWIVALRGGERVLDATARVAATRGEIDGLYVLFDDGTRLTDSIDALERHRAWIGGLPGSRALRRWMLPLFPSGVRGLGRMLARNHRQRPVDLVISGSSAAIKGLKTPDGVPHLCYCHAPARYVWSLGAEYSKGSFLRGLGLKLFGGSFRRWDRKSASHVTKFLANSTHIQREIQRCFGRESTVVFPPVRTEYFVPPARPARDDFVLCVGALEPYKKTEDAIRAAFRAKRKIVVVGEGSQDEWLREMAHDYGDFVVFKGRLPDAEVRDLMQRARCLLFPQIEDFGITAVEAQACGLPVVARRAGGALDTVVDGVTGVLYDAVDEDHAISAMVEAIARCPAPDSPAIRGNSERFAESVFLAAMGREVDGLLGR